MNLFDAHSIVSDLGLIGILAIIFAETGLLVGLAFPGDSLLFLAGVAASGSGAAILGDAHLSTPALFIGAPIAAITGAQVGHWFGHRYGRKLFDRPDGRVLITKKLQQLKSGYVNTAQVKQSFWPALFLLFAHCSIQCVASSA